MRTGLLLALLGLRALAQPFASPRDSALLSLAPDSLRPAFDSALLDAGQNWPELAFAVATAAPARRAEVIWLINMMPHLDRLEMNRRILLEHVDYAHIGAGAFKYHSSDSLFRNYILTYRVSDEPVTAWRKLLYERFAPMLKKSQSSAEAARIINRWLAANIRPARRGFFGPMKSPDLVLSSGAGTNEEVAVLAAAILKSIGVPSRRVRVPWLGAQDNDASWLEVFGDSGWLPCYPLEPKAFGDFGWLEREHADNVTIAVATSAFDQQLVTQSYTTGAPVRVRLTAAGVPLPEFGGFAFSVFNAGAWRPLDELNTFTDSSGAFGCFLGNGQYLLAAGQRDPSGDPLMVTRQIAVESNQPLDVALDLTAPPTDAPAYVENAGLARLLPDIAGGIASTLPPRGKPGVVISFDPALPVAVAAFRAVQQMHDRYAKKGLFALGIALADPASARAFAQRNGLTFRVACDPGAQPGPLGALNVENYGLVTLYDKHGTAVYRKARPRPADIRELTRKAAALVR